MAGENLLEASFRDISDLRERETQLLKDIEESLGFHPTELLSRSQWWGSEVIGAFMYAGIYNGQDAVVKVQGMKPQTSEITMLEGFAANQSAVVRPPRLLAAKPWDDQRRYEALVIERLTGPKLISRPTNAGEVREFFAMYSDYRQHCRNHPWLTEPKQSLPAMIVRNLDGWQNASHKLYPNHPYRQPGDKSIIQKAAGLLQKGYGDVKPEFQHKHISSDDVFKVGEQYVLTSNFMWGWGAPYNDAVFAYHWFPYIIGNHVDGLASEDIHSQKDIWLNQIHQLPQSDSDEKMLTLALLERQLAGLVIDSLTIPLEKPLAKFLVDSTRQEVEELIEKAQAALA